METSRGWGLLCLALFVPSALARLPWGSIKSVNLQGTRRVISFDPLALLAILHNPRAAASAARLYYQQHLDVYRWPHAPMIGGALPPFKLLVDHLASRTQSEHPAVELLKADSSSLAIECDFGFPALPLTSGNFWLADILAFKPSRYPQNDLLVVYVRDIHGRRTKTENDSAKRDIDPIWPRVILNFIDYAMICLLVAGLICGLLSGDIWSTTLFSVYLMHAATSTVVSFRSIISSTQPDGPRIKEDPTTKYAVYKRQGGGKIVFKARKDTLETWARSAWTFEKDSLNHFAHWLWMLTGALSAAASVICMVNMAGYLQLAYLGTLCIASASELIVTQLVRHLQNVAIDYGSFVAVKENETWTQAIVRASLQVDERYSLAAMPWIRLGYLPDYRIFRNLCGLLADLHSGSGKSDRSGIFEALARDIDPDQVWLAERITEEVLNSYVISK